jgi:cation diffusion facilitator family transporter
MRWHSTGPTEKVCRSCAKRVPWYAFAGNLLLTFYKVVVGFLGGSPALIADGIHSFTDVIGTTVILVSTRLSERPASRGYPYGYGKVEFMSSLFIYVVLVLLAIFIFISGLLILLSGHEEPPHLITLFGGLVSVLYNVIMFRLGQCAGKRTNSPALLANSFENRADAISSVAVCIGIVLAILIHPAADPLAAMLVGVIIVVNCIHEGKKAVGGLMDRALPDKLLERIRAVAQSRDGVVGVSFARSRNTGTGIWLDLGIEVDPGAATKRAEAIADDVRVTLLEHSRHFAAVEIYVVPQAAGA